MTQDNGGTPKQGQPVQEGPYEKQIAYIQQNQTPLAQSGTAVINGQQALQHASQLQNNAQQYPMASVTDPMIRYPGTEVRSGVTVFLYGSIGTRKTTWAGTWPRALFLSIGPEGGDDALAMLPSLYGIPAPPVYHIASTREMSEVSTRILNNYQAWNVNTLVIDSLTYYIDMWMYDLLRLRYPNIDFKKLDAAGMATNLTYRDWNLLGVHTRDLAMRFHGTRLNVIWIALEKISKVSDAMGDTRIVGIEPFVKGEAFIKIPGMCKMVIYAQKKVLPDPQNPQRMMIQPSFCTSPTHLTKDFVRHKYGNAFPEGELQDCTFRSIYERIGNFVYMT
jgi:hypothetical protein